MNFDNDDVIFIVDGKRVKMDIGYGHEINNQLLHHVENNGESNRIHLIIDCYSEAR